MELLLQRQPSVRKTTFGEISLEGEKICDTLEDVVREDPNKATPHNEAKVYGETAIPAGRYRIGLADWSKFGPDSMYLENVPGFTGIFIHGGFDDQHTHGCILVGIGTKPDPDGDGGDLVPGTSKDALALLKRRVVPAIKELGLEVWITVQDA